MTQDDLTNAIAQELKATDRHTQQVQRAANIVRALLPALLEGLAEGEPFEFMVRVERGRLLEPVLWRERKAG